MLTTVSLPSSLFSFIAFCPLHFELLISKLWKELDSVKLMWISMEETTFSIQSVNMAQFELFYENSSYIQIVNVFMPILLVENTFANRPETPLNSHSLCLTRQPQYSCILEIIAEKMLIFLRLQLPLFLKVCL